MVQGEINRGRHTDHVTIQLGTTPSGLTSAHLHHPPWGDGGGRKSIQPVQN